MGRRPRAGDRPVCGGPRRDYQRSGGSALRLGCHRRRAEPVLEPHPHGAVGGRGAVVRSLEQRAAGFLGQGWRKAGQMVLSCEHDADRLCRLQSADGQHTVLLVLHQAEGPAAAQHCRAGARRQRDGGLCGLPLPHRSARVGLLCQEWLLCQRPRPGGASERHRLRPFTARRGPALPVGEPPEGAESYVVADRPVDAGGQRGLSEQPARGTLGACEPRLHAEARRHVGAPLQQEHADGQHRAAPRTGRAPRTERGPE